MKKTSSFDEPGREVPTLSSIWLTGAKAHDPESWNRLVQTFGPIVYRWCRTSGVAESDAADVVQDVFVAVSRALPRFEREASEGSFRGWLATITRNKIRDYFRKAHRGQMATGGTDAHMRLHEQAADLESTVCADSIQSPVVRLVLEQVRSEFEATTWNAFWQTTIDGMSAKDVSDAIGISVASVYQAKSRVLRRLRQLMAEVP